MAINTYRLDSITLCAFLLTQEGIELVDLEEDKFHHFSFILSNPTRCEELKHQFLNRALAPAIDLFAKREMLMSEIKSKSQNAKEGARK